MLFIESKSTKSRVVKKFIHLANSIKKRLLPTRFTQPKKILHVKTPNENNSQEYPQGMKKLKMKQLTEILSRVLRKKEWNHYLEQFPP